jgi:hypothetical protein
VVDHDVRVDTVGGETGDLRGEGQRLNLRVGADRVAVLRRDDVVDQVQLVVLLQQVVREDRLALVVGKVAIGQVPVRDLDQLQEDAPLVDLDLGQLPVDLGSGRNSLSARVFGQMAADDTTVGSGPSCGESNVN